MNVSTNTSSGGFTPPSKEQTCATPLQPLFLALTIFLIVILIVTFIGNLLVLLTVVLFRRLRSTTNYFIVSLAVSDLLISLLSLPFRIDQNMNNGHWCLSMEACKTWLVVDSMCTFASMWNLAIISIDRFTAIKLPYKYHSLITTKVGYGMISAVWIYSLFLALMMFINWTNLGAQHFKIDFECANTDPNYYTVVASLSFFLPLLIIIVMYGMVFEVALNQTRAMAALQVQIGRERDGGRRRTSINLIREVKAAKTLAVVVGCFIFCWFPFNVILLILLWKPELVLGLNPEVAKFVSLTFIYVLPALNSTMNPIIYAILNREFRSAFGKLFKRITGSRLGAVGGGGTTMESTSSRSCSMLNDPNIGPYNGVRFSDSDSSARELPAITQCDTNKANTEQLKPVDNTLIISQDPHSMETELDDNKRTKMDENGLPSQNGHVSNDVTLCENDVTQYENDVIKCNDAAIQSNDGVTQFYNDVPPKVDNDATQNNNDVMQCDNDATPYDSDVVENVKESSKFDMTTTVPLLSPSSDNDSVPAIVVEHRTLLPPIESNILDADSSYTTSTPAAKGAKRLNVAPSPDCARKNNEDESSAEKVVSDDTPL